MDPIDEMLLIAMRAGYGCDDCNIPCGGLDGVDSWLCPKVVFGHGEIRCNFDESVNCPNLQNRWKQVTVKQSITVGAEHEAG